jgi:hypothetical protein
MSTNRKLRRAQRANEREVRSVPPSPRRDKDALRRQQSAQRFATAGSDRLWPVLLGWDTERVARAWLVDTLHDAARRQEQGVLEPDALLAQLELRVPGVASRLDAADVTHASGAWLLSGDDYAPDAPAPKWSVLSELCLKAGLGHVVPAALQEDWELWTNLGRSGQPRQALLASLAQTEQAALALLETTKSENVQAVATLARLSWVALAYGDADAFARLREQSSQWLAGHPAAGTLPAKT